MNLIRVSALQSSFGTHTQENIDKVTDGVEKAAASGAQIILPPELFENVYFCTFENESYFSLAHAVENHPTLSHFQKLAAKLKVVLPVSFFERDGQVFYNSLAMINADGQIQGVYRKSHIPDGPGYEEKFYFRPGNTGFRVWQTAYGRLGVGICWDQWFPEAARAMTLLGAQILLYPTAIGTEPEEPGLDTKDPWQRVMIGHAVANVIPVVAANRIGREARQSFYGHSFICDHRGNTLDELGREEEGIITATFDFGQIEKHRAAFGLFRDRRPDLYSLLAKD